MSPVGRPDEMQDGRPARVYRGAPNPLGVATEWVCPSCRQKNEGRRFEEGCQHCGVGVPDRDAPPIQEPKRAEPPPIEHPSWVKSEPAASWEGFPPSPQTPPAPLVVTRLVQYRCHPGQEQALEQTLQRSLVGRIGFAWGEIVAAIVDDVSSRQQDILGLAQRQPGVWLGGPEVGGFDSDSRRAAAAPEHPRGTGERLVAPALQVLGEERMTPAPPNTGPAFTETTRLVAEQLIHIVGFRGAYTLALALQNYAELADQESMEPDKIYTRDECLQLANALMTRIPDDWDPAAEAPSETLGDV